MDHLHGGWTQSNHMGPETWRTIWPEGGVSEGRVSKMELMALKTEEGPWPRSRKPSRNQRSQGTLLRGTKPDSSPRPVQMRVRDPG